MLATPRNAAHDGTVLVALAALVVLGCGPRNEAGPTSDQCTSTDEAIRVGRLVDPADGSVLEDAVIVIAADRIRYVGTDRAQIPCGARIIDWTAFTGLPGLVDAHTHLAFQTDDAPGTLPWERAAWLHEHDPARLTELARRAARATLRTGVTTVIDKGSGPNQAVVFGLRDEIAAGKTQGPRVLTAGTGLHGPVTMSRDELQRAIEQAAMDGVDLIKVWADDCGGDRLSCTPSFTAAELRAAVDAAHRVGKPIAIHAYHADVARLAIMAGPDSIEHPEGIGPEDFAEMLRLGVTYVPTVDHNRYYRDNVAYFGYAPSRAADFAAYIRLNLRTVTQAYAAGVTITMGSDAVFSGFGQNTRELEWLVEAGMTPLEAIRAATVNGAASIGVDDEIGKVAAGYYADIIAVEGDPLVDVGAVVHGVRGVMKGGVLVEP